MKITFIIFSILFFSLEVLANEQQKYSNRALELRFTEKSPAPLFIEAVSKGVFMPNDYLLTGGGEGLEGRIGSSLAYLLVDTYQETSEENLYIVNSENVKGLNFLLSKGLNANLYDKTIKESLIISAAGSCNLEAVKSLIKYGANPLRNDPEILIPKVTARFINGANNAALSPFNAYTENLPIEKDICFNTFKFFMENIGVDLKHNGCGIFISSDAVINWEDRYYKYIKNKYGPDFLTDCEKLQDKQLHSL